MTKVAVKNAEGKQAAEVELSASVYGIEPNISVMHQAVRQFRAALRQGTHSTKSRGLVSGGGRKPWRQKGTGRARQGSTRSPQWKGGGVVFGPTPRDYSFKMNNKEVKLAMRSALSAKLRDEEIVLVEAFDFEKPSTKEAVKLLAALGLTGKKVTVILEPDQYDTYLSLRNIDKVSVLTPHMVTTYDIIDNGALLMTSATAQHFGEVLQ